MAGHLRAPLVVTIHLAGVSEDKDDSLISSLDAIDASLSQRASSIDTRLTPGTPVTSTRYVQYATITILLPKALKECTA